MRHDFLNDGDGPIKLNHNLANQNRNKMMAGSLSFVWGAGRRTGAAASVSVWGAGEIAGRWPSAQDLPAW
jgi:hypothetical protein